MNLKEKQIIYVDNKPHIKCNVVMLPTRNEDRRYSHIYKFIGNPTSIFDKRKTNELKQMN